MANANSMNELLALCKAWNGDDAGFAEVVASYLKLTGANLRDVADEFEAAVSTVSRWANGIARPHPKMQRLIVSWIERRASKAVQPPAQQKKGETRTGNTGSWPIAAKTK